MELLGRRVPVAKRVAVSLVLGVLPHGMVRAAELQRQPFEGGKLLIELEGTPAAFTAALAAGNASPAGLADRPRVEGLFETDVPAKERALTDAAPGTSRRWVVVSPAPSPSALERRATAQDNPWDVAHDVADGRARAGYRNLSRSLSLSSAVKVVTVEPDVTYVDPNLDEMMRSRAAAIRSTACQRPTTPGRLNVCATRSPHWPSPSRFAWHLEDDFSQLGRARDSVPEPSDADRVTVAHLDTGFDEDANGTNPPHLDVEGSYDFTLDPKDGQPQKGGPDTGEKGVPINNAGHGTGTLGILAAGDVEVDADGLPPFKGRLGGVPQARVVEYRISASVANFNTGTMSWAIGFAPTAGVDVISMSMGAVPSKALAGAVNEAYEHGTAVVAAAGNFFVTPILGTHSPTLTVPPAYFARVVSVTGVTADDNSYSKAPCFLSLRHGSVGSWAMRGSYGPPFAMEEAIASYTPNVPWIEYSGGAGVPGLVGLDGQGTSAATPQVAAAVALWLQKHRHEFSDADWRSWRKVEAAFRAIRKRAKPSTHTADYRDTYFGAGILQAADALQEGIPDDLAPQPAADIGFAWVDVVFATLGPSDTGPDKLAPTDPAQERLRRQMFRIELAQLVFASRRLQDIVGDRRPDDLDPATRRALLSAARDEPDCSRRLREAIDRALAAPAS